MLNIDRADELSEQADVIVTDMFDYHKWDADQEAKGGVVREALKEAVRVIIQNVPPCPDRTVAIRKLRDCRMDCNSAITHKGKY